MNPNDLTTADLVERFRNHVLGAVVGWGEVGVSWDWSKLGIRRGWSKWVKVVWVRRGVRGVLLPFGRQGYTIQKGIKNFLICLRLQGNC